jgi:hypothetical protein
VGNGFGGADYILVAGPLALLNFGTPVILFRVPSPQSFIPVAVPHHVILADGATSAEFGITKEDVGFPVEATIVVQGRSPDASTVIDQAPNAVVIPWLIPSPRFVVATPAAPGSLRIRLRSNGLDNGTYEAKLLLESNDLGQPLTELPITLTVTGMTPVVLAGFSATPGPDGVLLTWRTTDEVDHLGFHVFRRQTFPEATAESRLSTELITAGQPHSYSFIDANAAPGHEYEYRLADVSRGGDVTFHGPFPARVPGTAVPAEVWLSAARPNPARGRVAFSYGIPAAGPVRLRVYGAGGRLLRTLEDVDRKPAGYHEVSWDGRDERGMSAPSGVYFYQIEAAQGRVAKKVMWVK